MVEGIDMNARGPVDPDDLVNKLDPDEPSKLPNSPPSAEEEEEEAE